MLDGVDISGWDEGIDVVSLTADFVIVKATEGVQGTIYNPTYRQMADDTIRSGKLLGFYHYANGGNPIDEADSFWSAVKDYGGRAVLALDWEGQGNRTFKTGADVKWCKRFLDRLAEVSGAIPFLYTSKGICNLYDWSEVAKSYPLWGAEYAYELGTHTYLGYLEEPWQSSLPWGAWGERADIFQYGEVLPVPSSGGSLKALDADKAYANKDIWQRWCGVSIKKLIDPAEEAAEIHAYMCEDPRFGYSKSPRYGGDYGETATFRSKAGYEYRIPCGSYDCSSSTITAWRLALSRTAHAHDLDDATYTGDMRNVFVNSGLFTAKYSPAKRGDLYLAEGKHVAMCQDGSTDNDILSEFNRNENHSDTGGKAGDQDGGESVIRPYYDDGWNTVLHYVGGFLEDVTDAGTEEKEKTLLPIGFVKLDGDQTEHFYDGHALHALKNPDEKKAIIELYEGFGMEVSSKAIEIGTKEAPMGARLVDALSRGPQFATRELFEKHPTNDTRFKALEAKVDTIIKKLGE